MKCVISGTNLKIFGRAIHSISKIGDELYIEAIDNGFSMRTVNSARSAYACILFLPEFFLVYKDLKLSQVDNETPLTLKCKINMKPIFSIFKTLQQIEKTVDQCEIKLDLNNDKLIFKLRCKHGIIKTHHLAFIECEAMEALFSKPSNHNYIECQSKFLQDVISNFLPTLDEITLNIFSDKMIVSNYIENENDLNKTTRTELILAPNEFNNYQCSVECKITFCIKELKALLLFSDPGNLPIAIYFDSAGRPMILAIENEECYKVDVVLATLADSTTQVPLQRSAAVESNLSAKNKGPGAKNGQAVGKQAKTINSRNNSKENVDTHDNNFGDMSKNDSIDGSFNPQKHLLGLQPPNNDTNKKPFTNFISFEDSMSEDDLSDIIPITKKPLVDESSLQSPPPNKKFRSLFFGISQEPVEDQTSKNQPNVLVSDSDEDK